MQKWRIHTVVLPRYSGINEIIRLNLHHYFYIANGSQIATKFCDTCFAKLQDFHRFKSLALCNEAKLSWIGLQNYVDDGVKSEPLSQTSEDEHFDEQLIDFSELQQQKHIIGEDPQIAVENQVAYVKVVKLDPATLIQKALKKSESHNNERLIRKKVGVKKEKADSRQKTKNKSLPGCSSDEVEKEKCDLCGNIYRKKGVKRHMRLVHNCGDSPYICEHCEDSSPTKEKLFEHILLKHPETISPTDRIRKKYRKPIKVKKKYKNLESSKCEYCDQIFHNYYGMQRHIRTVHIIQTKTCPYCSQEIKQPYLKKHIRDVHERESRGLECQICHKKFPSARFLKRHSSIHTNEKPFSCDVCGARFRLKDYVVLHKRQVHDKLKEHVCHLCSKAFFSASVLRRHIAVKHERTSYPTSESLVCPECGKLLCDRGSLKKHRLTHTGVKSHVCEVCGKCFTCRRSLARHMKVHRAVNYKCQICDAKYKTYGGYWRHKRRIHDGIKLKPPKIERKYKNRPPEQHKKKKVVTQTLPTSGTVPEELCAPSHLDPGLSSLDPNSSTYNVGPSTNDLEILPYTVCLKMEKD